MRLCLDKISVSFGENKVLNDVSFVVNEKDKIAIVGKNGSGKTTLLKVITGEQEIDSVVGGNASAKIQKTGKFQIGYMKQIAFDDDSELFENEILKVYKPILDLKVKLDYTQEKLNRGTATSKEILNYEQMLKDFESNGGYTYLKEYNNAIKQFGFLDSDKNKKLSEFSGGQRTKIALLKLLLSKPDILILDEPTNHLDITSIIWLEEYLREYKKAVIVVSHDRAFLDKFVNVVYEIERGQAKKYIGNYTAFIKTKELNYEKDFKDYLNKKQEKDRLQALADRFRYKATKAKMAQSKLKEIERMGEIIEPPKADTKAFSFDITPAVESGKEVMALINLEVGYEKPLCRVSYRIMKGDRIGVIGGNGLGKSTLLKTIVQKIPMLGGKIEIGTNVEIGYFDQQVAKKNIQDNTILEDMIGSFPDLTVEECRNALGAFCFSGEDVFKSLKDLSGGELVRLELCKILKKKPNFLILDEPTNHMDILSREAFEKMLSKFKGTIIFVSHDRYFISKIATSLIVFENGEARVFKDTTYADYERIKNEQSESVFIKTIETNKKQEKEIKQDKQKNNIYLQNKERAKREAKQKQIEKRIEIIENEISDLENKICSPEVYSDYIKVMEYQSMIDNKKCELEKLFNEWENLV